MKTIVADIETGALPESELLANMPPFDPADVKYGNIKDPEKIKAKLAEAESSHKANCLDGAALDALTGKVLAIGVQTDSDAVQVMGDELGEQDLLTEFWDLIYNPTGESVRLIGFNIIAFDLPFLIRRSWKLGVRVPAWLREGRYWSRNVIDLRDVWQLGDRQARGSLDAVSRHLGVGAKTGDGKDFATLWRTDRDSAIAYLRNDVELAAKVAARLGVIV